MKSTIIIHLCVLVLTIVSDVVGELQLDEILETLKSTAKGGGNIGGIFKPSEDGLIGRSSFSIIYKGILISKKMEVSMKFTTPAKYGAEEHEMYKLLGAIDDTSVEVHGIPSIHHYSTWENCSMMAMTSFDPEYQQRFRGNMLNEIDLLILFHEFVRITKYTHNRRVYHVLINLRHMMFRKQEGFIYDFVLAAHFPNGIDADGLCAAREHWKQFLRAMYTYINKHSSRWSWLGYGEGMNMQSFFSALKTDAKTNEPHEFSGLRRVFIEFAKSALSDSVNGTAITESFYDRPLRVIVEEIGRCAQQQGKPVTPSWLITREGCFDFLKHFLG